VPDLIAEHEFVLLGRAEPRCAATLADRQRVRHRPDPDHADPALRRHPDYGAIHRPGDRGEFGAAEGGAVKGGELKRTVVRHAGNAPTELALRRDCG
jgi:hypothetical protein